LERYVFGAATHGADAIDCRLGLLYVGLMSTWAQEKKILYNMQIVFLILINVRSESNSKNYARTTNLGREFFPSGQDPTNFPPMNLSLGMHELDKKISKDFIFADTTQ
jgi:hypothetical protein